MELSQDVGASRHSRLTLSASFPGVLAIGSAATVLVAYLALLAPIDWPVVGSIRSVHSALVDCIAIGARFGVLLAAMLAATVLSLSPKARSGSALWMNVGALVLAAVILWLQWISWPL